MKAALQGYKNASGLVQVIKVTEAIIQLVYADQASLSQALLRFEEHYEGEEFRGKVFTLGQYRAWYSQRYGAWTYYSDWSGFNIPSDVFHPFFQGDFDPLTPAEQEVVELFRYKPGPFYVIGTYRGGDPAVYEHEICHALYALEPEYREAVDRELAQYENDLAPLRHELTARLGYNGQVLDDECHAYVCESTKWLVEQGIPFPQELHDDLQTIKKRFAVGVKRA